MVGPAWMSWQEAWEEDAFTEKTAHALNPGWQEHTVCQERVTLGSSPGQLGLHAQDGPLSSQVSLTQQPVGVLPLCSHAVSHSTHVCAFQPAGQALCT